MYLNFQQSYYGRNIDVAPCMSRDEFHDRFLIVFDCKHQVDNLKTAPVDVRLEIETAKSVPAGTACYCLIIHDKLIQYSALSNIVRRI